MLKVKKKKKNSVLFANTEYLQSTLRLRRIFAIGFLDPKWGIIIFEIQSRSGRPLERKWSSK